MKITRRHFLQAAGTTLTTLGLNQWQLNRTHKVFAQPTSRKLALLVGINKYANPKHVLGGCVNDVVLQRQLLVHRFGFKSKDIVMLLDEKATRQGILDAFEEHLVKQAKPGDVVVYHYSGHGSLVRDPDPIFTVNFRDQKIGLNGTFVPVDSNLPTGYPDVEGTVNDIMGHTLFLLMSAIKTENFTAVLDSCYSGAATRNIRVRSREGGEKVEIAPQEKAYQDQWLTRLGWTREEFSDRYRQGIANGVILASTQRKQTAVDEDLIGFTAGAFTYRLTQHLWQTNTNPRNAIAEIIRQMPGEYNQTPLWEAEAGSDYDTQPLFFVNNPSAVANALVIDRKGTQAQILLGGIPPESVNEGVEFISVEGQGRVKITSRQGLVAMGDVSGQVSINSLLRTLL